MKKGFSLIEIIIGMIIITVLIFPIILFFNQTVKNFTYGKPNSKTVEVVTDAINEIETLLRQAESVESSDAISIGFIIPKDGELRKIIFKLDNNFIKRTDDFGTKYTPYYNNPNSPANERVNLELVFKYFDENGNLLPYGQPNLVRLVEISIKGVPYELPQGTVNPEFYLQTMVKLRNIN